MPFAVRRSISSNVKPWILRSRRGRTGSWKARFYWTKKKMTDLTETFSATTIPSFSLPLMKVNCITRKRDTMMWFTYEMMPPFDHAYIADVQIATEILSEIMPRFPHVQDLAIHPLGWGKHLRSANCRWTAPTSHSKSTRASLFTRFGVRCRGGRGRRSNVIVVGPDVDPSDMDQVAWALATRVQPLTDTIQKHKGRGRSSILQPLADRRATPRFSEQLGIDATIKVPERFDDYPLVANADPKVVKVVKDKLARYGL